MFTFKSVLSIVGFRDTYLGGKLFRGPEEWGQLGVWGELRAPLAGYGVVPQPKSNLVPFKP